MFENIINTIENDKGYLTSKLSNQDLKKIRKIVEKSWITTISKKYPNLKKTFLKGKIYNYHKNASRIDHSNIWTKKERTLSKSDVKKIKNLNFYKKIKKNFKSLVISDEEKIGHGIINYRIVRPNIKKDVGPLHSDRWFWEIDKKDKRRNYKIPTKSKKFRIWLSLYCHKNYGFKLVPFSQNKKFKFKKAFKHGRYKPIFKAKDYNLKPKAINSDSGNFIIFNDNLIHGGKINKSKKTRVSMEFTLFAKE